jgi:BirA family biotin operon repressor/biotin-[acetyl-CoA-carboxylase] ligase
MSGNPAALSAEALARHLSGADLDWEIAARTASTNAELVARARLRAPWRPVLLATDEQSAGRGRQGRAWHATPGGALLLSLALPWSRRAAESAAVTLACGVGAARCLEREGVRISLKWPNDLLFEGRKLGGILTELTEDDARAQTLVVGLGLNLFVGAEQRRAIGQPVAELAECLGYESVRVARELWLARIALALLRAAQEFEALGFAPSREFFLSHCAYLGLTVCLQREGREERSGILRGVDESGRLLLENGTGTLAVNSGELSLRAVGSGKERKSP